MPAPRRLKIVTDPRIKKRPCLKCDRPFLTTPEMRLCWSCKQNMTKSGCDTGYDSHHSLDHPSLRF
jgi:hypothetical protein